MNFNIDKEKVPIQVQKALTRLHNYGYQAYLVGGAVRDLLLDKTPKDWDLATNAPLEEIEKLFRHVKIVGASFGVALVKIGDIEMQIARFRSDSKYTDYRHPDKVNFVNDVIEDLKRRDFTINSFAWNQNKFRNIPGALDDLKAKVIRTVGNPSDRFNEDPLRMLRAIRFAVQLNMFITNGTFDKIQRKADLIQNISAERIQEELNKILLSDDPMEGMLLLHKSFLLKYILPELIDCFGVEQNKWHNADVYTHILRVVQNVPKNLIIRLTGLLHDIGKPQCKSVDENGYTHFYRHEEESETMAREILKRLKYDNDTVEEVCYLVLHHMEFLTFPDSDRGIRKLLNRHGEDRLKKLIEFRRADMIGSGKDKEEVDQLIESYFERVNKVLQEKPPTQLVDLAIDGNDIMEVLNLQPGKAIGKIKERLMEEVLDNPGLNTRPRLLNVLEGIAILKDFLK